MKYLFSFVLFMNAMIAFFMTFLFFLSKDKSHAEDRMLALFSFASGIWSVGFGALFIQTDPFLAYICRSIGILGTILYLVTVLFLTCQIIGIPAPWRRIMVRLSCSGIFIYILAIQRNQTTYMQSAFGMTYQFRPGVASALYTAYFSIVAACILGVIIYGIQYGARKRIRYFSRQFLFVAILIVLGTILDMVFPALGLPALPGSNLTQFWGLAIIQYAMLMIRRCRITLENTSMFIYDSLAIPVLVYDDAYRLRIVNDAAAGFFHIEQNEQQHYPIPTRNLFSLTEARVFSFEGDHHSFDTNCEAIDTYCNLAVSKIHDTHGDIIGYIVLVTDLSERQQYIAKLQQAKQEADSANLAKSAFLANMSHEIRTPMNAIIGFSELALKELLSTEVREYLTDIKTSSHNLLSIINDILDFSKIESGKMELICDNYETVTLFRDISLLIREQARKKGLDFSMSIAGEMPSKLYGDTTRIHSVLVNILNNAVKYTPEGSIRLEATVTERAAGYCVLQFDISDTGIGIREEDMEHLFDSFSQADQKANRGIEGTGLGLALVKGYCVLMGGTVSVSSVYGKGSTFTVTIRQQIMDDTPMDQDAIFSEAAPDDFSLGTLKISDTRVLIVDDNPINLKVISQSMKYYGLTVDTAESGEEALSLCGQTEYPFVFMDQMMPKMDGIETMKRLRALGSYYQDGGECKIIVLTANAISGVRDELLSLGFDEYLSKPVNFQQMEEIFIRFLPPERLHREASGDTAANETLPASGDTDNIRREDTDSILPEDVLSAARLIELLPEIDLQIGLSCCGGHIPDFLEILDTVSSYGEGQLLELLGFLEQKDYENYTILIHAMKGSCQNIGATKLGEQAKALEAAGKRKDYQYIDTWTDTFVTAYRKLLAHAAAVLSSKRSKEEQSAKVDAKTLLTQLLDALHDFDFASADKLLAHAQTLPLSEQERSVFTQIAPLLEEIEVEEIERIASGFLQSE